MSDALFDDPAGRTRSAWARTLMVTFVASLFVERLFFARSWWGMVVLLLPVSTIAVLTLVRSRPLRRGPRGFSAAVPFIAGGSVLVIATAALSGVAESV